MPQWPPSPSSPYYIAINPGPWPWEWEAERISPAGSHKFAWKVNPRAPAESVQALKERWLCHILISFLPDDVIPGLLTQIAGEWEYATMSTRTSVELPANRRFKGKIARRSERQTFPLEE